MPTRNRQNRTTLEIFNAIQGLKEDLKAIASRQEKLAQVAMPVLSRIPRGTRTDLEAKADKVLKDIQLHPGTARKDIADRVKLAPQTVTKIVMELRADEKILHLGSRRTTRWFAPGSLEAITKP